MAENITTPEQMRAEAAKCCDQFDGPACNSAFVMGQATAAQQIRAAIRAIPIAPQPATDWTACAADMLRVWNTWFGGSADGDEAAARKLSIASAFAAQAFELAASSGITADGAPAALLRAFLLALIDPLHPDLDCLRADPASGEKARAKRGAIAPPVVAAPQPVAVAVKPLVWEQIAPALTFPDGWRGDMGLVEQELWAHGFQTCRAQVAEHIATLPIHPADPMSDPRVVALVEAAKKLRNSVCGPTGFAEAVRHNSGHAYPWPSLDDADRSLVAALRAIGGEA